MARVRWWIFQKILGAWIIRKHFVSNVMRELRTMAVLVPETQLQLLIRPSTFNVQNAQPAAATSRNNWERGELHIRRCYHHASSSYHLLVSSRWCWTRFLWPLWSNLEKAACQMEYGFYQHWKKRLNEMLRKITCRARTTLSIRRGCTKKAARMNCSLHHVVKLQRSWHFVQPAQNVIAESRSFATCILQCFGSVPNHEKQVSNYSNSDLGLWKVRYHFVSIALVIKQDVLLLVRTSIFFS